MSGEQAFSFSQGTLEMTGAGARAGLRMGAEIGARAFKTALTICCKSSSEYLRILVAVAGDFGSGNLSGCLKTSDSRGREESKGATEGGMERCSWRKYPRLRTEVILELISSKNILPNGLADSLGIKKLKL